MLVEPLGHPDIIVRTQLVQSRWHGYIIIVFHCMAQKKKLLPSFTGTPVPAFYTDDKCKHTSGIYGSYSSIKLQKALLACKEQAYTY